MDPVRGYFISIFDSIQLIQMIESPLSRYEEDTRDYDYDDIVIILILLIFDRLQHWLLDIPSTVKLS